MAGDIATPSASFIKMDSVDAVIFLALIISSAAANTDETTGDADLLVGVLGLDSLLLLDM